MRSSHFFKGAVIGVVFLLNVAPVMAAVSQFATSPMRPLLAQDEDTGGDNGSGENFDTSGDNGGSDVGDVSVPDDTAPADTFDQGVTPSSFDSAPILPGADAFSEPDTGVPFATPPATDFAPVPSTPSGENDGGEEFPEPIEGDLLEASSVQSPSPYTYAPQQVSDAPPAPPSVYTPAYAPVSGYENLSTDASPYTPIDTSAPAQESGTVPGAGAAGEDDDTLQVKPSLGSGDDGVQAQKDAANQGATQAVATHPTPTPPDESNVGQNYVAPTVPGTTNVDGTKLIPAPVNEIDTSNPNKTDNQQPVNEVDTNDAAHTDYNNLPAPVATVAKAVTQATSNVQNGLTTLLGGGTVSYVNLTQDGTGMITLPAGQAPPAGYTKVFTSADGGITSTPTIADIIATNNTTSGANGSSGGSTGGTGAGGNVASPLGYQAYLFGNTQGGAVADVYKPILQAQYQQLVQQAGPSANLPSFDSLSQTQLTSLKNTIENGGGSPSAVSYQSYQAVTAQGSQSSPTVYTGGTGSSGGVGGASAIPTATYDGSNIIGAVSRSAQTTVDTVEGLTSCAIAGVCGFTGSQAPVTANTTVTCFDPKGCAVITPPIPAVVATPAVPTTQTSTGVDENVARSAIGGNDSSGTYPSAPHVLAPSSYQAGSPVVGVGNNTQKTSLGSLIPAAILGIFK